MAEYLDDEAVASALQVPVEVVRAVLRGEAVVAKPEEPGGVVQIQTAAYRQRVVAVWRAKGGVGATALAVHLARDLAGKMRTLLADFNFDPGGSDLAHYLGLPPHAPGRWDPGRLGSLAARAAWEFDALLPPPDAGPDELTPELARGVVAAARRDYDAAVLDLPAALLPGVLEAVRSATTAVMVLGAVRREALRARHRLAGLAGRELYAAVSDCEADPEALGELLGVRKAVVIPHDPGLDPALERGVLLPPDSVFARAVSELRRLIYGEPEEKTARKAVFGWWARRRA